MSLQRQTALPAIDVRPVEQAWHEAAPAATDDCQKPGTHAHAASAASEQGAACSCTPEATQELQFVAQRATVASAHCEPLAAAWKAPVAVALQAVQTRSVVDDACCAK